MRLELAWGYVRRWMLKRFRPAYVARMHALRHGSDCGYPHEILDPRDLKFYQHRPGYYWLPEHDDFQWRNHLPWARVGLAEVLLLGGGLALLTVLVGLLFGKSFTHEMLDAWRRRELTVLVGLLFGLSIALLPATGAALVLWFFRNPRRQIPTEDGVVVAPADGRIKAIHSLAYDPFLGGPAIEIDIFLSVFNVHLNRAPVDARVIGLTYRPGKFLNALRPAAARENEQMIIRMEELNPPHRRFVVRQIAGAIARRIVCQVGPGQTLSRGQVLGMIKLGSRTQIVLPATADLALQVQVGQRVLAGATVLARYGNALTVGVAAPSS
jgi:phosphatidylserine decarboxylase